MAFTIKNSKCFTILKLRKLAQSDTVHRSFSVCSRHPSVCFYLIHPSHQNHAACSSRQKLLRCHTTLQSLGPSILQQRFMSSEDQSKKLSELASVSKESGFSSGGDIALHSSKEKVLFIDSASEITDKAATVSDVGSSDTILASAASEDIAATDLSAALPSDTVGDVLSAAANLAEPSLASLGLASSWTPVGLVQQLLELMHINSYMPMPWWATIVTGTIIARILMFPIFVKTQRNSAKFAYVMPQLQVMQAKFNEARRSGNNYEAMRVGQEISKFMKTHDVNPVKNALMPMSQFPVFISYFLALRNMARLPVESMRIGGFSWIIDLTIPDPFYIMPLTCCTTLFFVLKIGADTGVRMENMKLARYFIMAMPVILFPFCINFPSAVLFYWCTNNFLTLGLVLMLKHQRLRSYFDIPAIRKPDPHLMPQKKGFVAGMKEAFEDSRAIRNLEERRNMDEIRFKKAGTGPIPRTYAYDPTKPRPAEAAAAAKMHSKTKS